MNFIWIKRSSSYSHIAAMHGFPLSNSGVHFLKLDMNARSITHLSAKDKVLYEYVREKGERV